MLFDSVGYKKLGLDIVAERGLLAPESSRTAGGAGSLGPAPAPVAQRIRADGFYPLGRRFESCPGRSATRPSSSRAPRGRRGSRRGARAYRGRARPRCARPPPGRRTRRAAEALLTRDLPAVRAQQPFELRVFHRSPSSGSANPAAASSRAQLAARVVQRLVERAARRAEALGEHVDRHLVQRERDEHRALVRRERSSPRVAAPPSARPLDGILGGRRAVGEARASAPARAPPRVPATRAGAASRPPRAARTCTPRS